MCLLPQRAHEGIIPETVAAIHASCAWCYMNDIQICVLPGANIRVGLRTLHQSNGVALLLFALKPQKVNLPGSSTGEDLTNHLFNRHFFNIDVGHRQLIQQGLAGGNNAVPLHLQPDRGRALFDHFAVAIELRG